MEKDNLSNLLEVKNLTETSADLYFYGDIVSSWWGAWEDEDQYPDKVKTFLDEVKGKDLNIYINSGGGSVFAGMAIYNMLKRHTGYKTVYVDGLAGSIASVIALAGDKIIIPSNAYLMIHKAWTWATGNSNDLRKIAERLDVIESGIVNVYKDNIKENVDIEEIKQMMEEEKWFTGEEASEYFNIELEEGIEAVACVSDYFNYCSKVPKELLDRKEKIKESKPKDKTKEIEITNNLRELDLFLAIKR